MIECVNVISPKGVQVAAFSGDRIVDAHKIACDPSGNIWVVDRDAHEIVAFDPSGREIATLGARHRPGLLFNHPSDLCFGADGSIWVADGYGNGHIHHFTAGGTHLLTAGSVGRGPGEFLTPHGIGVLSDGRPVVADRENGRVQLFDLDGRGLAIWDRFYRPSSIWVDADDLIHVVDGIPTLTSMRADGTVVGRCRPTPNGPHGMSGHSDGTIYLAETNPHRISRLIPRPSLPAL
jgi:peptidylglycine monooxygenase